MKKFGFLFVPILVILCGTMLVPKLLASGFNSSLLVMISVALIAVMFLSRPKKGPSKSLQQISDEVLDGFCKDAFVGSDDLGKKFMGALNDISRNLPKTAVNKLKKLEPECTTDAQKYAVALASALCYRLSQDYKNVIREYNKAIVLNPTPTLAYNIGECNQRLGNLDKARDSYEFAQELDPTNPQYPSSLGTVCVGDGDYDSAMDYAQDALAMDETFPQALATMAICYGMKNDALMHKHYLNLAMDNGYSQQKIEDTIKALKKRER